MNSWVVGLALLLVGQCAWAQGGIRLRNRTVRQSGQVTRQVKLLPPGSHYILQFGEFPGPDIRSELARRHIRVLGYVPDSALMVASDATIDLNGLEVSWSGQLDAADKMSPTLAAETVGPYLVVFHADTAPGTERAMLAEQGLDLIANQYLLPDQFLVTGDYSGIVRLAEHDAVAYVLPASADLVMGTPVMGCAGPITEAGAIAEYVEAGRGWSKDSAIVTLQYVFQSLTTKLDRSLVKGEIERAFREWQKYANITLSPAGEAGAVRTIAVQFVRGAHGDSYPFDGPGGVLGHTFYPVPLNSEPIAGDMHLDADEDWHVGTKMDLYSVVLHEAGHALGLTHSDRPGAVMYPYYHLSAGLTDDDIAGIRDLYGSATSQSPVQPPVQPPVKPPVSPPVQPSVQPPVQPPVKPSTADTTAPSLRIASPGSTMTSTSAVSMRISGTASDEVGVTAVKWSTSNGDTGTASGTTAWSADVPLLVGGTVVTVRAYDAAGNSGWRSISIVRR
jgi:hypothetical protein